MNLARWTVAFLLICGSVPAARSEGRSYRLSPPRELVPSDDVVAAQVSPDEDWLVFVVSEGNQSFALYSVPTTPGPAPILLALTTGEAPLDLVISPDSTRVLFLADVTAPNDRWRLYGVPIDGSGPAIDLTGKHVKSFAVTPDSARIVCAADFGTASRFLLWSLPIAGGAPLEESGPLVAGADVKNFVLTPDGTRAIYRADATTSGTIELHSALIGPVPGSTRLDVPANPGFDVSPRYVVSADGLRVVYRSGDSVATTVCDLYSAPVDGSAPAVRLNPALASGETIESDFALSADGTRAVYRRVFQFRGELFSVPADGSAAAIALTPAMAPNLSVRTDLAITPDGSRVVYRVGLSGPNYEPAGDLYSVPIDGSAAPLEIEDEVEPGFVLTREGRVVFVSNGLTSVIPSYQLWAAPVDGSAAPSLLDPMGAKLLSDLTLTLGGRLVYSVQTERLTRLWSVRLDASAPAVELSQGQALGSFGLIRSAASIFYVSDDDVAGTFELFVRKKNGATARVKLSQDLPSDSIRGDVLALHAAGKFAVYVEHGTGYAPAGLFSVPIAGGTPISLVDSFGTTIDMGAADSGSFQIAGQGGAAVFVGIRRAHIELFSAPVNGSAPPVVLNGPMQLGASVQGFSLSKDRTTVLYRADQEQEGSLDLFRVPFDGSSSAVRLSAVGAGVASYRASDDGQRVVYTTGSSGTVGVYGADGSGPPVKLSGVTPATFDVQQVEISADGAWAFWNGDPSVDSQYEVYRAPTDGSAAPTRIAFVPGGSVRSFALTPGGARVVFFADGSTDALCSVPADGSAPAQNLSTGGTYALSSPPQLDPSGTRVLYLYRIATGPWRLYSAPVDGSAPETLISPSGSESAGLTSVQVSADGTRVVYGMGNAGFATALYSSRLDGSGAPLRLDAISSPDLIRSFRVSPDGKQVAYFVFQSTFPNRLFSVPIDRRHEPVELTSFPFDHVGAELDYEFAADSLTLLYRSDADVPGIRDVYAGLVENQPRRRALTKH